LNHDYLFTTSLPQSISVHFPKKKQFLSQIPLFIPLGQKPFLERHGNAPNRPEIDGKADIIRDMKSKKSSIQSAQPVLSLNDPQRLARFFDLLMTIDKRNNPELYEHNKSGTSPDQTTKRSDGICLCRD
jgi:hypothetical protein